MRQKDVPPSIPSPPAPPPAPLFLIISSIVFIWSSLSSSLSQGCQSSAFRRNSAFLFFFFLLSAFLKLIFRVFLKNRTKKIFFFFFVYRHRQFEEPDMRFFRFRSMFESVSPLGCRISIRHLKSDARRHAACWRTELQCLRSLPFHPHHFTLSLSLCLCLTHTHTDIQGCQLLRFRRSMLWSVFACYTRAKNVTVTFRKSTRFSFLIQRLHNPSPSPPSSSLSRCKQRSAAKNESSIVLD